MFVYKIKIIFEIFVHIMRQLTAAIKLSYVSKTGNVRVT
jgi:hypothetical protein